MRAAIGLVTERQTAAVPISDIAEAADVSRQVVYQQFGDRDTLLLEAALDLAQRELIPRVGAPAATRRERMLAMARHFAEHRAFYRAMLTGSCGYALNKALTGLILPLNRRLVRRALGGGLDPQVAEDVALSLTGAGAMVVNTWVVEGEDPLDPETFADRLMRVTSILTSGMATR